MARTRDSRRTDLFGQDVCGVLAGALHRILGGLDDPRWSFLTVFVVSQPDSGLVLAKSFYRILGTVAGVLVYDRARIWARPIRRAVRGRNRRVDLLSATLPPVRCAISRPMASSSQATRWQSSVIPAALEPTGAYPLVVARCTEIPLGIVCAALVSRLVFVREL